MSELMTPDMAAYPNTIVSAPCSLCAKQVDVDPRNVLSKEDFLIKEPEIREEATWRCGCA